MGDVGPGDAVDARQAAQRLGRELRELPVVIAWQALADLKQLRFDQMEIVEQPLGGRTDRLARPRIRTDQGVNTPQHLRIAIDSREESVRSAGTAYRLGARKTSRVLLHPLGTEHLRADGFLDGVARTGDERPREVRRACHQAGEVWGGHGCAGQANVQASAVTTVMTATVVTNRRDVKRWTAIAASARRATPRRAGVQTRQWRASAPSSDSEESSFDDASGDVPGRGK